MGGGGEVKKTDKEREREGIRRQREGWEVEGGGKGRVREGGGRERIGKERLRGGQILWEKMQEG